MHQLPQGRSHIYCSKYNRMRSFARHGKLLFVCDTHSPSPSNPKCFASALLQVIDHIETFEICNLSHNLAAEDGPGIQIEKRYVHQAEI